ncbi:MAG: polysaccharide deacetylase family protein [Myxococcota bacterium]|nr:polysaccharide deacetylase family protein [Myxococcota bacterium]
MQHQQAIVSIHDVSPAWEREVKTAMAAVASWGIAPPGLLVVPDYHGAWPLTRFPAFAALLQKWHCLGSEILLHGYEHLSRDTVSPLFRPTAWCALQCLTAGEGEFLTLGLDEAAQRVQQGKAMLEETLALQVAGFVPPAWLRRKGLPRRLAASGMTFYEGHLCIHGLAPRRRIFAPAITFSARSPYRIRASLAWAAAMRRLLPAARLVRLALHPADFRSERLVEAIGGLVASMNRRYQWIRYCDLL